MEKKARILLMEPFPDAARFIREGLEELGQTSIFQAAPEAFPAELKRLEPELAILGPSLPEESIPFSIQLLRILKPGLPVLVACRPELHAGLCESGPFEGIHCLSPRLDTGEFRTKIESAFLQNSLVSGRPEPPVLIGESPEMREVRSRIRRVAAQDTTVLITGETGTGKELVARALHHYSRRNYGPLVKINCGALPEALLESEVFGYQEGAFTGALRDKPGRLELAHRGTLFIDEIGNLSLPLQAKFLQLFEDRTFSRLGGTEDKPVDVRVIAATNANLADKMREGSFRKDLFFRLNVTRIDMSPLRARQQDIPLLLHFFLNKFSLALLKEPLPVPPGVDRRLRSHPWPGNVRELENIVRRAIVLRDWQGALKQLSMEAGPPAARNGSNEARAPADLSEAKIAACLNTAGSSLKQLVKAHVSELERDAILEALSSTGWNRKRAAELLAISYKTLLNRITDLGLKPLV